MLLLERLIDKGGRVSDQLALLVAVFYAPGMWCSPPVVDLLLLPLSSQGSHSDGKDAERKVQVLLVAETLDTGVWCLPPSWLWHGTR